MVFNVLTVVIFYGCLFCDAVCEHCLQLQPSLALKVETVCASETLYVLICVSPHGLTTQKTTKDVYFLVFR
jgi:hypothetical protein